jgi:protein TonB
MLWLHWFRQRAGVGQQRRRRLQATQLLNMFSLSQFTCLLVAAVLAFVPCRLSADETIYAKVDVNPVPTKTPPPKYPDEMKRAGVSGVVAVTIVIDEQGEVASAVVAKSTNPEFEAPALAAVKKWKFKPGKKDGVPVKVRVTIPLRFDLEE